MTEPTSFARRLAGTGFHGPFRVRDGAALIEDRAGHPMILALQVVAPASARQTAEIAALALNRLCGFPAVEDKLDPEHIDDVRAESARFRAPIGRLPDAAE